MAEESWTINLECDGAAPGEKYVLREMDRDHICFFNLIGLIEEYGYSSVDYLYYKRRCGGSMASLVVINFDSDVMNMLQEFKDEKKVSLFVTREEASVNKSVSISPAKSREEPSGSAQKKAKGRKGRKKCLHVTETREQYANEVEEHDCDIQQMPGDDHKVKKHRRNILSHVWDLPEGKKVVVRCNTLGQPIGKEGGLLGKFLGTVARNGGYCPLDVNDWRKVKKDGGADTILQFVQTKFLYPRSCEKWILKSIGRDWRRYKATLKKTLFNPMKKRSSLYKLCPDDVDEDQWVALVRDWKSKKGKTLSEKNKRSCEMKKTTHTAGTKSYARWAEDLRQDDPDKKVPHRAKVFLATHKKKAKGTNKSVVELKNLIDERPELAENNEGRVAWQGDALNQVLGEEKPGQVHGLGLLPVPKQAYGRTSHHFKDINVAIIDGPSSDVEAHMLKEIKLLKDHSRKQDQRIEELLNERTHHENSLATNQREIQKLTVHSRRKRVECNIKNQEGLFTDTNDETEKQNCEAQLSKSDDADLFLSNQKCLDDVNHKELSNQEGESSSPACPIDDFEEQEVQTSRGGRRMKGGKVRKRYHGASQETTSLTQHELARDTSARNKKSKYMRPSPIKVGSTVVLKTAKYPNKEVVAYATLLSSSPEAEVGGVPIGNQFCKVRVNHAIAANEPLVRPMSRYKIVGDAHAKGAPIAWPSVCVEMING